MERGKMIDIHTHIGYRSAKDKAVCDERELLRQMDALGIKQAVLLPLGASPECSFFWYGNEAVIQLAKRYPDRFIAFCDIDPRNVKNSPDSDFMWILEEYKEAGCKGVGEMTANLYIDDPLCMNLLRQCGKAGMPVIYHCAEAVRHGLYGMADDIGLPRLEKVLWALRETTIMGHAMSFWSEISADVDPKTRGGYPKGRVKPGGRLPELLRKYPNLCGDLSAGSGFNAISRDPEFGYRFLEEFQDKLLLGTDICHVNQKVEIVPYLKKALADGKISQMAYNKIVRENAIRLLGLKG